MENLKKLNLTILSDNHFSDPNLTTFENILRTTKKNIYNIAKGSNSNLLIELNLHKLHHDPHHLEHQFCLSFHQYLIEKF